MDILNKNKSNKENIFSEFFESLETKNIENGSKNLAKLYKNEFLCSSDIISALTDFISKVNKNPGILANFFNKEEEFVENNKLSDFFKNICLTVDIGTFVRI